MAILREIFLTSIGPKEDISSKRRPTPLFSASAASGITEADTSAWNNKLDQEMDGDPENEMQSFSVPETGDTLFLSESNYVIVPGISEANSGGDGGSGGSGTFA